MSRIGIRVMGENLDHRPERFILALEAARRAGYQAVEILPDDFDLIICGRLCKAVLNKIERILRDYLFEVSVHVPLRLNLFDRSHGDIHLGVLHCCAEICDCLGASMLVYHPGRYVDNVDFPRYGKPAAPFDATKKSRLIDHEKTHLARVAREFPGLTFAMENLRPYADYSPYSYAEFIGELVEVICDINLPNVRMTLDTGHLNLAAAYYGADPLAWARKARPWVAHTHIHDNHGIVNFYTENDKEGMLPFGRGDEHNVPGSGTFPFDTFFSLFREYGGLHLFEPSSRFFYPAKIQQAYEIITELAGGAHPQTASEPTMRVGSV